MISTIDLDPEIRKYLEEQEARQKNIASPEYQSQLAASRNQDFEASTAPQEVAAYAKSFSQLGTLGGKSADTSAVSDFAKNINQQQGVARQQQMADDDQRDKQTGLRMKTMEYLQNRGDKQADIARQENRDNLADKRARDLDQSQSDRAYGIASMQDKRARELAELNHTNAMQLAGFKGGQEAAMTAYKAERKDPYEELPKESRIQIEKLSGSNANKLSIASQIDAELNNMKAAYKRGNKDQAIIAGKQMLKALNSPEGSDAVGAEEVKRLGSLLEYQIANFTNPGPMFGRDVEGFFSQAADKNNAIKSSVEQNNKRIEDIYAGKIHNPLVKTDTRIGPFPSQEEGVAHAAPGKVKMILPNGSAGWIPEENMQKAIERGARRAE